MTRSTGWRWWLLATTLLAGCALIGYGLAGGWPAEQAAVSTSQPTLSPADVGPTPIGDIALGEVLYGEQCASCHGASLEGQPNWREPLPSGALPAPPHDVTGHTWHHSDAELLRIIAEGGTLYSNVSDMPGFADILTDDEMRAVLAYIKTSWEIEERSYQEEMNWQEKQLRRQEHNGTKND